jgi:hypothetical protein
VATRALAADTAGAGLVGAAGTDTTMMVKLDISHHGGTARAVLATAGSRLILTAAPRSVRR